MCGRRQSTACSAFASPAVLTLVLAIKLVAEIALCALSGQWVLGKVCGPAPERNPFYSLLQILTRPWLGAARRVWPRRWLADQHVPALAFGLLLLIWCAASVAKVKLCLTLGGAVCR